MRPKYGIPFKPHRITTNKLIFDFESKISFIPSDCRNTARQDFNNAIKKFVNTPSLIHADKNILHEIKETKIFQNNNQDSLFLKADKGNTTVVMNKQMYEEKMLQQLSNNKSYKVVRYDLTCTLQQEVKKLTMDWSKSKLISDQLRRQIAKTDCLPPRAYGLPKIHKPDTPVRIIVSFTDSPTINLARFLSQCIGNNIDPPLSRVRDSFALVNAIRDFRLPPDHVLVSLDVVSLFTNVPQDLAINAVKQRWHQSMDKIPVPLNELIKALHICFRAATFKFNQNIYAQTYGLPMGSPLSPILSDLVLDDLEQYCLNKLDFKPSFYFRYEDDIITAVPSDKVAEMLSVFNQFHPRLQFTSEIEFNHRISFLDVLIINNNQLIKTDWFHKATWSQRY
ncbi:uncharacterized protein LOC124295557 [Neodiprion lecontei]|uniref:Uncharacterized protein LOC124295557 n=1 Tax=Neodiprion lecontei TaxID=441921 RepID=A0ABM3GNU1_NEOLC|nr:uncharacterized protein LOC124295557 [Neodiprion lecontei]